MDLGLLKNIISIIKGDNSDINGTTGKWYKFVIVILVFGGFLSTLLSIVQEPLVCEFPNEFNEKAGVAHCLIHGTTKVADEFKDFCTVNSNENEAPKINYLLKLPKACLLCALIMLIAVKSYEFCRTGGLDELKNKDGYVKEFYDQTFTYKKIFRNYFLALCLYWIVNFGIFASFDAIIHESYLTFGYQVIAYYLFGANQADPICQSFPLTGSCEIRYFDVSGAVQENTSLCTMNVNLVNSTFYLALWFYLWILIFLSPVTFCVWLILGFRPKYRAGYLGLTLKPHEIVELDFICQKYTICQYFILYHTLTYFKLKDTREIIHSLYRYECGQA